MSTPGLDLSGLADFSKLMEDGKAIATAAGKPLSIALDMIDENPKNSRTVFDPERLQELADAIAAKGVHSPISVRPHPTQAGRYVINHGARRFRASKLAGKTEIPAFVDEGHDTVDMLTENIQREDLSTRELVDAIAALLSEDNTQADVARKLGKSKTWVSKYVALSNLPDPLAELLASGRCKDASTLYEALQCYKAAPEAVAEFIASAGDRQVVQADIEALRATIKRGKKPATVEPEAPSSPPEGGGGMPLAEVIGGTSQQPQDTAEAGTKPLADVFREERRSEDGAGEESGDDAGERKQNVKPNAKLPPDPTKVRKPLVQVRVGRREAVLLVAKAAAYGLVWVEYEDGTTEEMDAAKIKVVAITEGAK